MFALVTCTSGQVKKFPTWGYLESIYLLVSLFVITLFYCARLCIFSKVKLIFDIFKAL